MQMLERLWDLSVAEEHIYSQAIFYFICLDIMLYSGTLRRRVGAKRMMSQCPRSPQLQAKSGRNVVLSRGTIQKGPGLFREEEC